MGSIVIVMIFNLLPGLFKLVVLFIVFGIPLGILFQIYKSVIEKQISEQMNSNPQLALQTVIKKMQSEIFTVDEYEDHLIKIAESTGYIDAILKLIELYSGKKYKEKKDETKYKNWQLRAIKAGDVTSIMDYYGFTDYDVASDSYSEIFRDLDHAKAVTEKEKAFVCYLKGIVYYKIGKIEEAKRIFALYAGSYDEHKYMLFRCFVKEANMAAAEKMLDALSADKFEILAEDYLHLYHYYASKRNSAEADHTAEIKYIDRYAASRDSDPEITDRIGGDTYYYIATGLQKGSGGFEKNEEEAMKAYEKAADFGNPEALYYLGNSYWIGDKIRNYDLANEYLSKAANKGHEKAKEILEQYGVEDIIVSSCRSEKTVYQFMNGYKLTASANVMKWLQLYYGIRYKEMLLADEFSNAYGQAFESFDQMINGIQQLYADYLARMLQWSLHLLMSFCIDTYDAAAIMDACKDLSLLPRVPVFEQELNKIDNRAMQLKIETDYLQAMRGKWSGAGFGTTIGGTINAAIKASVTAGIMNAGSEMLHGIGDSIVKSINNSEIKSMEKKVFENPATEKEFRNALISACNDIADVLMNIMEIHYSVRMEELSGRILFGSENLAEIDDRALNAKINNNLSAGKVEYVYALQVEKLRRDPFNMEAFQYILMPTMQHNNSFESKEYESVYRFAGDFRLDSRNLMITK